MSIEERSRAIKRGTAGQRQQQLLDAYLPAVMLHEAAGIVKDLIGCPEFRGCAELQGVKVPKSVTDVDREGMELRLGVVTLLRRYYDSGMLRVNLSATQYELHGYAMWFDYPDPNFKPYLHKVVVFKPYRGQGYGLRMIKKLAEHPRDMCLICNPFLDKLYEKVGMKFDGYYPGVNFTGCDLTRGLYNGLAMMSTKQGKGEMAVFVPYDDAIQAIFDEISRGVYREISQLILKGVAQLPKPESATA